MLSSIFPFFSALLLNLCCSFLTLFPRGIISKYPVLLSFHPSEVTRNCQSHSCFVLQNCLTVRKVQIPNICRVIPEGGISKKAESLSVLKSRTKWEPTRCLKRKRKKALGQIPLLRLKMQVLSFYNPPVIYIFIYFSCILTFVFSNQHPGQHGRRRKVSGNKINRTKTVLLEEDRTERRCMCCLCVCVCVCVCVSECVCVP